MSFEHMLICDSCGHTVQTGQRARRSDFSPAALWCDIIIPCANEIGEHVEEDDRYYELCPACASVLEQLITSGALRLDVRRK